MHLAHLYLSFLIPSKKKCKRGQRSVIDTIKYNTWPRIPMGKYQTHNKTSQTRAKRSALSPQAFSWSPKYSFTACTTHSLLPYCVSQSWGFQFLERKEVRRSHIRRIWEMRKDFISSFSRSSHGNLWCVGRSIVLQEQNTARQEVPRNIEPSLLLIMGQHSRHPSCRNLWHT